MVGILIYRAKQSDEKLIELKTTQFDSLLDSTTETEDWFDNARVSDLLTYPTGTAKTSASQELECPLWIGDGFCDDSANTIECNYDGGDCCGSYINELFCTQCLCISESGTTPPINVIGNLYCIYRNSVNIVSMKTILF